MRQPSIRFLLLIFFSTLAVLGNEHASAQTAPVQSEGQRVNASLAEFTAWNQQMQEVVVETVHVMQATPHPPASGLDAAGRRQWAANARTWAEQAHATFSDARAKASRLTPPPRSDLAPAAFFDALEQQRTDLPHVIDSCDQLANSYTEFADAVERNN